MKVIWTREEYVMCCISKDRSGIASFKAGIWNLRGMRKGLENGRCPLCNEEEDAVHMLLNAHIRES
jgi:hypothetical protein